jgi:hypothetical protein
MLKRIAVIAGIVACTGVVTIWAPGFAREIAAGVVPAGKSKSAIQTVRPVVNVPVFACPREPWPYGCDWRPKSGPKLAAKRSHAHGHRLALSATGSGRFWR